MASESPFLKKALMELTKIDPEYEFEYHLEMFLRSAALALASQSSSFTK